MRGNIVMQVFDEWSEISIGDSWSYRNQKILKRFRGNKVYARSRRTKNGLGFIRTCTRSGTYVRRVLSYKERSSLPKHAALSCTICSNMSVAVGALVWTGRSVSSLRRGDEEDTRCRSSVPWDREKSDEIHGVNSPSHLLLPFPFTSVSFSFSPFALAPFNRALALLRELPLLFTFEESLANVCACIYVCVRVCLCVYAQQAYRDKSKGPSAADSRTQSGQVHQA